HRATRITRRCLVRWIISGAVPCSSSDRLRTSTNTSTSPSRATMSSSPALQRKLRSTIRYPASTSSWTAALSADAPRWILDSTTHEPSPPRESAPITVRIDPPSHGRLRSRRLLDLLALLALLLLDLGLGLGLRALGGGRLGGSSLDR